MKLDLDFDSLKRKPIRCKNCRKLKGNHKAYTFNCPSGMKTRIGYIDFDPIKIYEPREGK